MRPTLTLQKQNIGWYLKKFWIQKGAIKVQQNSKLEQILGEQGHKVYRPEDILRDPLPKLDINVIGLKPKPLPLDNTHPNWHDRPILTFKDNNVLLEGLTQAKILTKTVEVQNGLPENIKRRNCKEINKSVKEAILVANVFDAEQKKLPKIKDPQKPAWNFPRIYGITQERSIKLLLTNLLHLIESRNTDLVRDRYLFEDLLFSYQFERLENLVGLQLRGDIVLTSSTPLKKITNQSGNEQDLPNIEPISPIITLESQNIYEIENIYPINLKLKKSHPHTIFINHIGTEVGNIFEEEVTEQQILGRSLLKAFTVAASYAKEKYGGKVSNLPEPVTVQAVQTDGRLFHFGVLQLNTLDLENGSMKNIWYQSERIPLFEYCQYRLGKPVLEGYNSDVVEYLDAFYRNV